MGAYKEEFPVGSSVKIIDTIELEEFARSWKYHHPIQREQMEFAGKTTEVESVAFYHGGDALYKLGGLPGYWHEQCLTAATKS
jgi:hypothetical protein